MDSPGQVGDGGMVSLVIVAHSRALAEALVALARQVASADVRIAVAAGAGEGD